MDNGHLIDLDQVEMTDDKTVVMEWDHFESRWQGVALEVKDRKFIGLYRATGRTRVEALLDLEAEIAKGFDQRTRDAGDAFLRTLPGAGDTNRDSLICQLGNIVRS